MTAILIHNGTLLDGYGNPLVDGADLVEGHPITRGPCQYPMGDVGRGGSQKFVGNLVDTRI